MKITFDTAGKGFLARLGEAIIHKVDPEYAEREARAHATAYQPVYQAAIAILGLVAQRSGETSAAEPKAVS